MQLKKILIPLDGSALAESAIAKAVELAGDWPVTFGRRPSMGD